MAIILTASDRADIERIVRNSASGMHETLAKHFIAVGLDRAAARCDEIASQTWHGHEPSGSSDDGSEGHARTFSLVASAIRALK